MRATVRKMGNSASVRIPAAVLAESRLRVDQLVDVRAEGGAIVIEPVVETFAIDGEALLAAITPENLHPATDWGPPVGKEVW